MPRDGSGNATRLNPPGIGGYVSGDTIESDVVDSEIDDIYDCITKSLASNGETVPTANLPMGGKKHTGVADASADDEYVSKGQADDAYVQDGAVLTTGLTFPYQGLKAKDISGDYAQTIRFPSGITSNKTFSIYTGDASRTLTISDANVTVSSFGATLTDDADAATARTTLGLVIGTNVQAYDGDLDAIAALSGTGYAKRTGTNTWTLDTPATGSGPLFDEAFGYDTGVGGTVTQITSKSTGVTLNKLCGEITTHGESMTAGSSVAFTLTNSMIAATDVMVINQVTGSDGYYVINARCASGQATITLRNVSAASRTEAVGLRFAVIKAVTS